MVHTDNNLKNKSEKKDISRKDLPVYPFTVDINSFPERKYLIGIYKIAKFSYISLFISIILCLAIIIRSYSIDVSPNFIYFNDIQNKFLVSKTSKTPNGNNEYMTYLLYLNEYFVRTYIKKRFEISNVYANNYKNWCECSNSSSSVSKMGIFNNDENCYLCRFSSSDVYRVFLDNEKTGFEKLANSNITKNVEILDINFMYSPLEDSNEQSTIDKLLGNTKTINIKNGYKVDFIVETISKGKTIETDVLIAYIEIAGPKLSPEKRGVISAAYMFNPNYEIVIKDYLKNKEAQNGIKQ